MSKKDFSYLERMSPEQLIKYYKGQKSGYRRLLSKFTSLLRFFFGKNHRSNVATASEVKVRTVRGGEGGGSNKNAGLGLTVQKLKMPGKRELQKNLDALQLRDKIDELDKMIELCKASEHKGMNALVKDQVAMYNAMLEVYTETLHAMSELADNFVPDEVGDIFKRVQKYFDKMEKQHAAQSAESDEDDELAYYINVGVKDGGMDFILNCDITHWRNYVEGVHKALVVVITVRAEPTETAFNFKTYVNILDRVALPYLYNLGTEIPGDDTAAIGGKFTSMIDREIARHNVVLFAVKADLKVDQTEVQTLLSKIDGVSGVMVEPNEIVVEFPEGNRDIQMAVLNTLNGLREVKALTKKGYTSSLRSIDGDQHSYSLTLK